MQRLPLYFDLRLVVDGGDFLASVGLRGRITCEEEFGSIWMYGVNPGGLAENGEDLESAYANFRRALTEVVSDCARRAADFGAFRDDVEEFLMGTTEDIVDEWVAARQRIRDGNVPDLRLLRETADLEPVLHMQDLTLRGVQRPSVTESTADSRALLAA